MRRAVGPLLALTVALVLADSAVVTLALPDILRELDTSVGQVAWVLIAFNLVLGVAAVPAAMLLHRSRPAVPTAIGIAVFAGASAWCAVAGSIDVLIGARCLQAVGGAVAVVGCLELLVALYGERRGVAVWATAGVVGTATGPFAGGLLTELISWQSIFVVQVPIAALAVPAALAVSAVAVVAADRHRPDIRPNLTLALLSAALTAALFLLVLLLVEGWSRSPGIAAVTVSVVPIAAVAAGPLARLLKPTDEVEVAVGCFLIAGGLTGLAILPSAHLAWTIAPQALVGLGLGLTVDRLTAKAVQMRLPRAEHAGWTIGARHLGVVVGLAILTPVFTADLLEAQEPAQQAITALVLDAPLQPEDKIAVAEVLGSALVAAAGSGARPRSGLRSAGRRSRRADRRGDPGGRPGGAARARRDPRLPGLLPARRRLRAARPARRDRASPTEGRMTSPLRAALLPVASLVLVAGVLGTQLANGGGAFEPLRPPDPCAERVVTSRAGGLDGLTERLVLLGVADAACTLGISRETLTLELAQSQETTDAEIDALRDGLLAAVEQLEAEGSLPLASELVEEALDNAELNRFLEFAIRALPDSVIDGALKTDDVLVRAIGELDLRELLGNLDEPGDLDRQIEVAITQAVKDSLLDRVRNIL